MKRAVPVPVSALEHWSYCRRQCALIHVERVFEENVFTVRGRLAHTRVDRGEATVEEGVRFVRALPLWSDRYGLVGKADLVEFRPDGPYPVEYKVGRRGGRHPDLQLCAQALCLEEMLDVDVRRGAVFHHATARRREIELNEALRAETIAATEDIRAMLQGQSVPTPRNDARCPNCSLIDVCLPRVVGNPDRLRGLQGALFRPLVEAGGA